MVICESKVTTHGQQVPKADHGSSKQVQTSWEEFVECLKGTLRTEVMHLGSLLCHKYLEGFCERSCEIGFIQEGTIFSGTT